jgi:hypothetical protein
MKLCSLLLLAARLACAQQGSIAGTVVDNTGSSIPHAGVKLAAGREVQSSDDGQFSFAEVPPGPWSITFTAKGFAPRTITGELKPGEDLTLPATALSIDNVNTAVNVTQTRAEIAEAQIKLEEKQRIFGLIPNFLVSYDPDPEPLDARQKLELTTRTWFDPSSFVIEGIAAGIGQWRKDNKGFGQGAKGYAKRYAAGFADYGTSLLIENTILSTVFKQDPRYLYKGTGSTRSRIEYALSRTFVCRGDNRKSDPCYATLISILGTGFITNYYYPPADRDSNSTILRNGAIGIGGDMAGNLFQEFVLKKLTRKH